MDKINESDVIMDKIIDIENKYFENFYGDNLPLIVAANIIAKFHVHEEQDREVVEGFKAVLEIYNHLASLISQNILNAYHPLTRLPISEATKTNDGDDVLIDFDTLVARDEIAEWYINTYGLKLEINEPSRKNDWYYCIKDHAMYYQKQFKRPPTKSQLWAMMFSDSLPSWSLQIDERKGQIKLGGKALDRETFKKRFNEYFPSDNGE